MTDGFILGLIVFLMAWAAIRVRGRKPESWLPRELRRASLFACLLYTSDAADE